MLVAEVRPDGMPPTGELPPASEKSDADAEAFFRTLYLQHGKQLLWYAVRLLRGDWHRAQDVLQEAAIRAWRHVEQLGDSPERMRPWLFTVVRNLVIDSLRAQRLRPAIPDPLENTVIAVADEVDRLLTTHVVADALGDLTEQQREILRHMYFNGISVAQASEILGIPQGTVKSRTHGALQALKRALTARGVHG
ncbi:sigma-70 family RNA polymerase sigma factor [Streptomyces sp. NPDC001177]